MTFVLAGGNFHCGYFKIRWIFFNLDKNVIISVIGTHQFIGLNSRLWNPTERD